MKKILHFAGALSALLIGISASAAAQYYNPNCCVDPCEWSFCDGKFVVEADWLYWQTEQTNMNLVSTTALSAVDATGASSVVDPLNLNKNYESGYRVALGYEMPSNGWEFKVAYDYMPFKASGSAVAVGDAFISGAGFTDFLIPASLLPPSNLFAAVASKWDGNINNIDVDVGRTLVFGECFHLHPHIGFRALWIDQNYKTDGVTIPVTVIDVTSFDTVLARYKEKQNSYGVEAGLGACWNIGYGLSLIGHFGGSILYSQFKVNKDALAFRTANDVIQPAHTFAESTTFYLGTPTLEYFLGLAYDYNFCETELNLYAGWEQHVFFDVNQLLLSNTGGDLYTQGLTLGLRAKF